MSTQKERTKIVNANDNYQSCWLRMGYIEFTEMCAPFIPLADWLIRKHCQEWWKNHPEVSEYQSAQMGICGTLAMPRSSREWTLRCIARDLRCNPIQVMNDFSEQLKNLPVFVKDDELLEKFERILQP